MFKRILLAIDGTPAGEVAASFLGGAARCDGAVVRVLHVNEMLVGGRGFAQRTDAEARQIVEEAVRTLVVSGIPAIGEIRTAYAFDVPTRIVDAASDWAADAIVLGARRRRASSWARRLSPPAMHQLVAARTSLPVLIAPAPLAIRRGRRAIEVDALSLHLFEADRTRAS